jgi:Protein of unknown function (DUF3575)
MKRVILFLIALIIFLIPKNTTAQPIVVKASAGLNEYLNSLIYDFGIETRLYRKWTGQVSFTKVDQDISNFKELWSFQIRRYFNDKYTNSPYCGLVVQKHFLKDKYVNEGQSIYYGSNTTENKWGLGLVLGYQLKIVGRFGLDFHAGVMGQNGSVEKVGIFKASIPNEVIVDNIQFKPRFFWGINFYFAFGKMPTLEVKPKL